MGEVDTLNSQLGLLLAELADAQVQWPALDELISVFGPCQHRLFDLGGELAMPDYQALQESEIERLEQAIDRWNQELGPLKEFILPGGSRLIALAHLCRSVTRTAERRCQQLNASETVRPVLLAYLNSAVRCAVRRRPPDCTAPGVWRDPLATRRRGSRRG